MAKALDALDYLARPAKHPLRPVCVLFGDEGFLKRLAIAELKSAVLSGADAEFSLSVFAGDEATWTTVSDELSTVALFGGGRRLVIIDEADAFVTRYRGELEAYVAKPRSTALLVLDVNSFPSNTRLYKALAETGLVIECKFPTPARLLKWLPDWATRRHDTRLEPAAVEALVEIVEPELGLFDQELAKLSVMTGPGAAVTAELVHQAVGGWRVQTTWEMLDAAAAGRAREALVQLDHLLASGESPIGVLSQIASTLRRFAAAARLVAQAETERRRLSLRDALEEAGFKSFTLAKAEGQLRQIGRHRAGQLYGWLLEADLALKGSSSSPPRARFVLEQLIARLSTHAAGSQPAGLR